MKGFLKKIIPASWRKVELVQIQNDELKRLVLDLNRKIAALSENVAEAKNEASANYQNLARICGEVHAMHGETKARLSVNADNVMKIRNEVHSNNQAIAKVRNEVYVMHNEAKTQLFADVLKTRNEVHSNFLSIGKARGEIHSNNQTLARLRDELHNVQDNASNMLSQIAAVSKRSEETQKTLGAAREEIAAVSKRSEETQKTLGAAREAFADVPKNVLDAKKEIHSVRNDALAIKRSASESVWGHTFASAIKGSDWLKRQRFYPGRWAIGYQFLYALYRILNSVKPKNILELGLGQSTNMIGQYVDSRNDVQHRVVEHDRNWIKFYSEEYELPKNTQVVNLEIEKIKFKGESECFHYIDFAKNLDDREYDFICIDAPFGGGNNEYSRVDVLEIIPKHLREDSFVIMIDDVNRMGEQNTIELIKEKLTNNGVEFCTGKYSGDKDAVVIASVNNKFVCSM